MWVLNILGAGVSIYLTYIHSESKFQPQMMNIEY